MAFIRKFHYNKGMSYSPKHQRRNKRNLLLEILKADGELTLIFDVPGEAPLFMKPYMRSLHEVDKDKFGRAVRELRKAGLIEVTDTPNSVTLALTKKGETKAQIYSFDELLIERPSRWDGFWHMVMFDIPSEKKVKRNYFRQKLSDLGFVRVQESIYAHPFPCESEIELIRTAYEIRPYVKMMSVSYFEGEEKYLAKYGLGRERTI
jgi:predicted transcriptional regulator/CRISPR/Cas system-associated endoribonuclease Cas2